MIIQNNKNPKIPSFHGYDARKLSGFVMNSNYAGIADEMRKIGELENFKVFLFQNIDGQIALKTDKFQKSIQHNGCWAQDAWGIVKNTLLARENLEKTQILRNIFNLKPNKIQSEVQDEFGLAKTQAYVDFLYNLPKSRQNGKEVVLVKTEEGLEAIDKRIFDQEFDMNVKILKNLSNHCHVKGGNYFITQAPTGENELLIGKNELKKFSPAQIKEMFKTEKVHIVQQADFHIDLFIRPLKDKKVLIADDEMMSKVLKDGFQKIKELILNKPATEREKYREVFVKTGTYAQVFDKIIDKNPYASMKTVEESLLKAGYEPIKVPGRLFEIIKGSKDDPECADGLILKHLQNYLNANVLINDKNELVYIKNKSNLDKSLGITKEIQEETGFSLEKAFLDAIKPHIDKIYFVSGENNAIAEKLLPEYFGGIHCMSMEIPKSVI